MGSWAIVTCCWVVLLYHKVATHFYRDLALTDIEEGRSLGYCVWKFISLGMEPAKMLPRSDYYWTRSNILQFLLAVYPPSSGAAPLLWLIVNCKEPGRERERERRTRCWSNITLLYRTRCVCTCICLYLIRIIGSAIISLVFQPGICCSRPCPGVPIYQVLLVHLMSLFCRVLASWPRRCWILR